MKKKVQITFDLDTKKLLETYTPLTGKDYTKAYYDLRSYFEKQGYEHRQGSVYHSTKGKNRLDIIIDIRKISKHNSWFKDCVKKLDYAYLEEYHDLIPDIVNQSKNIKQENINKDKKQPKKSREERGEEILKKLFHNKNNNSLFNEFKSRDELER